MQAGDPKDPERHPIAIALRRQAGVDDARVTKRETLIRRGKQWFRFEPPNKRLFKELQKTLAGEWDAPYCCHQTYDSHLTVHCIRVCHLDMVPKLGVVIFGLGFSYYCRNPLGFSYYRHNPYRNP